MAAGTTTTTTVLDIEIPEATEAFHQLWSDILDDWLADPGPAHSQIAALLELRELSRI